MFLLQVPLPDPFNILMASDSSQNGQMVLYRSQIAQEMIVVT